MPHCAGSGKKRLETLALISIRLLRPNVSGHLCAPFSRAAVWAVFLDLAS